MQPPCRRLKASLFSALCGPRMMEMFSHWRPSPGFSCSDVDVAKPATRAPAWSWSSKQALGAKGANNQTLTPRRRATGGKQRREGQGNGQRTIHTLIPDQVSKPSQLFPHLNAFPFLGTWSVSHRPCKLPLTAPWPHQSKATAVTKCKQSAFCTLRWRQRGRERKGKASQRLTPKIKAKEAPVSLKQRDFSPMQKALSETQVTT